MVNITTGDNDLLFKYDDLNYRKGGYEVYYIQAEQGGNNWLVGVKNTYNKEDLITPQSPNQFNVNGGTYSNSEIDQLVTDLSVVLGFNSGGGGGIVPSLQEVTDVGNQTTNDIVTTGTVTTSGLELINGVNEVSFNVEGIANNAVLDLPIESGMLALTSDISDALQFETLQTVTNRGSITTQDVIFEGRVDLPNIQMSDTPFDNTLVWDDSTGEVKYTLSKIYSPIYITEYKETPTTFIVKLLMISSIPISNPDDIVNNIFTVGVASPLNIFSVAVDTTSTFISYKEISVKGFPAGQLVYSISIPKATNTSQDWVSSNSNTIITASYESNLNVGLFGLGSTLLNLIYTDPSIITTAQAIYSLTPVSRTMIITLTGTSTTLNLPLILENKGLIIILTNAGSANSTIVANVADVNGIWEGGLLMNSTNINTGSSIRIVNDGLKYRVNS